MPAKLFWSIACAVCNMYVRREWCCDTDWFGSVCVILVIEWLCLTGLDFVLVCSEVISSRLTGVSVFVILRICRGCRVWCGLVWYMWFKCYCPGWQELVWLDAWDVNDMAVDGREWCGNDRSWLNVGNVITMEWLFWLGVWYGSGLVLWCDPGSH